MDRELPPLPFTNASQAESASTSLKKIANWDGRSQDIYQVLSTAFGANDYLDCIKNLRARRVDPGSYINSLDKVRACQISRQNTIFYDLGTDNRQSSR